MAQAHALLTAQMAEKIEKLAEMLEQLLNGSDEEVNLIRWRMLRITHQLANNLEEFDSNLSVSQLHEQTQWLIRKSRDFDKQYTDVELSLETVGKSMEALHNRLKQLDQRVATMSTGLQALQQHMEQANTSSTTTEPEAQLETDKKPVFELQFHIAKPDVANEEPRDHAEVGSAEDNSLSEEHSAQVFEISLPEATAHNDTPTVATEVEETIEEIEPALVELEENPSNSNLEQAIESFDEIEEDLAILSIDQPNEQELATEVVQESQEPPAAPLTASEVQKIEPSEDPNHKAPAPLRVTNFFDPRTLTLAERQRADNLKTTITLVEKFQLSKAFFNGDDSAFGQALDLMNKMQHLEEAEQHLAVLADQYRWDLSDPQLLVLIKAVWRKLGVR